MTTVIRRGKRMEATPDERHSWLRFTDGLIVDPRRCPSGILAKKHWARVPGLEVPGEPNAECACPKAEVA